MTQVFEIKISESMGMDIKRKLVKRFQMNAFHEITFEIMSYAYVGNGLFKRKVKHKLDLSFNISDRHGNELQDTKSYTQITVIAPSVSELNTHDQIIYNRLHKSVHEKFVRSCVKKIAKCLM